LKFHHFIENCKIQCQSLLHKMNDDKDKVKRQRSWQLIDAIDKNDTATASSLISSDVVNLNGKPWPLHHAVRLGRAEIMTMLLDAGADINAADHNRHVACRVACWSNQFDALKLLVERGANLAVDDSNGRSILTGVAQHVKDERFVLLLLDAGAPLDGLSNGELMGVVKSVALFDRLMARGVNLTAMRDECGATLCHYMSRSVTSENDLRFLVNVCGKDAIHAVDNAGMTPLHWASLSGNELTMRVFVELGAAIDRQDHGRQSALTKASASMKSSCVEFLLALGADVTLVDCWGDTACHRAAQYKLPAALSALVAAGGDLDQPDNNGETPRMVATRKNVALPTADEIDAARRRIAKAQLDSVRERAFQICLGLQPLNINALQLCEILMHSFSFGAIGSLIAFHQWWAIATKVKHFRDHKQQTSSTTTTTATNNGKQPWWAKLKLFRDRKQSQSSATTTSATNKETQ
jgi:ankyrin repeat protein